MIDTPQIPAGFDLHGYFTDHGLADIVAAADAPTMDVNDMITEAPYRPELDDLYRLHRFVIDTKRTTVLEFGLGWSTLVFAHALALNKQAYAEDVAQLRRNNPFEVHAVDNEQRFLRIAEARIPSGLQDHAHFHFSDVEMREFEGRFATQYLSVPLINPDFIYLDGPDQFNIVNDIFGFSTAHKDMMPMSCDILRFEHFLTPGTIIVVDGRAANARFLKANLQRGWTYQREPQYDQHVFHLNEEPLGKYNKRQLDFYTG